MNKERIRPHGVPAAFLFAGALLVGVVLLSLAQRQDWIDGDTWIRGAMVLLGLGIAAWGNRMPKALEGPPPGSPALMGVRQAVHRVGGWSMVLLGLVVAGLWAFAPSAFAVAGSVAAVCVNAAVVLGYIAWRGVELNRSARS